MTTLCHKTDSSREKRPKAEVGVSPSDGLPAAIIEKYRIRKERLAPGETETTIPLRRNRGHVYIYGAGWAGVWLNTKCPNQSLTRLKRDSPRLVVQQVGVGEGTFRLPFEDLDRLLPQLGARRRRRWRPGDKRREKGIEWAKEVNKRRRLAKKDGARDAIGVQDRRSKTQTCPSTRGTEIGAKTGRETELVVGDAPW